MHWLLAQVTVVTAIIAGTAIASTPQDSSTPQAADGAVCAQVVAALDKALNVARDARVLIIVARPGRGEHGTGWTRRRLHNVATYIRDWGLPADRVVTTIGDQTDGLGRVELYALDQQLAVITSRRNRDVLVSPGCEGEVFSYYPHKDWWDKHRGRGRRSTTRYAPN
jgi:hypothetical protein